MPDYTKFKTDPRYLEMSYEMQIKTRHTAFQAIASTRQDFQALSPEKQRQIYENDVFAPPDLIAPDARQLPTSPSHAKSLEVAKAAAAGDKKAFEELQTDYRSRMMNKKLTIIETLAVKPQQILSGMDKKERREYERRMDADNAKVLAYEEFVGKKLGKDFEKTGRTFETIGSILDYGAWWMTGRPMIGGSPLGATSGGVQKIIPGLKGLAGTTKAAQAVGSAVAEAPGLPGRAVRWLATRGAPELVDSFHATNIGILRSIADGELGDMIQSDANVRDVVSKGALMFGKEFVNDYMAFLTMYALATPLRAAKGIFGGGYNAARATKKPLNDAEFDAARKYVFASLGRSAEDFSRETPDNQLLIRKAKEMAATIAKVGELPASDPKVRQLFSAMDMFDIEPLAGDDMWKMRDLADPGSKPVRGSWDHVRGVMDDILVKRNNASLPGEEHIAMAYASDELVYKEMLDIPTSEMPDDMRSLAKAFQPDGKLNNMNIIWSAGKLLEKAGMSPEDVRKINITLGGKSYTAGDAMMLELPKDIITPKQQRKYYTRVVNALEDAMPRGYDQTVFKDFRKTLLDLSASGEAGYSPLWTEYQIKNAKGEYWLMSDGKVKLTYADRTSQIFDDDQAAARSVLQSLYSDNPGELIRQTINNAKINYGIKITQLGDGGFELSERGVQKRALKTVYTSFDEMIAEHPKLSPKLPVNTMPNYVITDKRLTTAEVDVGTVSGNTGAMMSFISNFKDWEEGKKLKTLKAVDGRVLQKKATASKYVVTDQRYNYRATFTSPKEAYQAMNRTYQKIDDVRELAANKGGRVELFGGQWKFYDADGKNTLSAPTSEELLYKVAQLEMPEYVSKEIIGYPLPDDADFNMDNMIENGQLKAAGINDVTARLMRNFSGVEDYTPPKHKLREYMAPRDIVHKDIAKTIGDPRFSKLTFEISQAERYVRAKANEANNLLHSAVGRISKKQQLALGELLESGTKREDWERILLEYDGVTEKDVPMLIQGAERVKVLLDDMKRAYDIDTWKWLTDYYPRIREYVKDPGAAAKLSKDAKEALPIMLGYRNYSEMPKVPQLFSNNLRTDDLIVGAMESNIFTTLDNYIRQGYRSKYLSPLIEQARTYAQDLHAAGMPNAALHLSRYSAEVTGFFSDEAREALDYNTRQIALKFYKGLEKLGVSGSPEAKAARADVISFANSLTVSATMSFRPWLAIRNSFQPYLTLGPRIGQDVVDRAVLHAAKNGEEIIKRLRARGVIGEMNPMMEILTTSVLTKYNNIGMRWYGNSDAWTRGVCDSAATLLMDTPFKKLKAGRINMDQFMKESMVNKFDSTDQLLITDALQNGGLGRAKDVFTDIMTKETMFPYKSAENPEIFKGVLGRVFGGFGHYSVNYTANLARGWSNAGGVGGKLAYAATVAGTSAALYGSFKYLLGVDATNFLFCTPAQFTGGPLWDLFNTSLNAVSPGYEGKIARKNLPRDAGGIFIPSRAMFKSASKALKALDNGDYYGFIIHGLSAPLDDEFDF